MRPIRPEITPLAIAAVLASILTFPAGAQEAAEPQIEPPPISEISSEVPPAVKPVPGEGSAAEDETETDTIALFYLRRCSGCHTVGGGPLDGPDLLPSTRWPRDELHTAVERMEKNVGPMTEEQITGLVDLMKSPDFQTRLEQAESHRVAEMAATLDAGSPQKGERLFFGETPFVNGGIACFACHAVSGRGGNMGVDLTDSHPRLGQSSLLSATEEPSFPLMRASYGNKPVTSQEAVHIAAYLEAVATEAQQTGETSTASEPEAVGVLHGIAGGLVLLSLGGSAIALRKRRAGTRSKLVRDSFRR